MLYHFADSLNSRRSISLSLAKIKHWWFSGRMLACHAGGPGSIPGQCIFLTSLARFPNTIEQTKQQLFHQLALFHRFT